MADAPGIDPKAMERLLDARFAELEALIKSGTENRTDTELDQQRIGRLSRMDAMQQQAMEDETHRRREHELVRVKSALLRLAAGDYGYCTACDEIIAPRRLENDPATMLCIDCANKAS
jgi:DnaK suppressor protein